MWISKKQIFCLAAIALLIFASPSGAESLAIVVNVNSQVDNISTTDLERYFKAEKSKTPFGVKVVIAMQEVGRTEREAALKDIYKMNEAEYTNFFVEATFTGAVSSAPKAFASGAAIKKFVSATPGAISYLRVSEVDESVKAVKINGKAPSDADYSLQIK